MAVVKFTNSKGSLKKILDYVMQEEKTEATLISGQNCMPETALLEMQAIKNLYRKNSGRQYIHLVQSFGPSDTLTHAQAHEVGRQLAARFSSFQCVIATHKDREHIHNHIIINSVDTEDGHKFQQSRQDMQAVKDYSDQLCQQAGLPIIPKREQPNKYRKMGECQQEQKGNPTWRGILKGDIDAAAKSAITFSTFLEEMQRRGYTVKQGKNLAFRPQGGERFIRLRSLGEGYTEQELKERIRQNFRSYEAPKQHGAKRIRYRGQYPPRKRKYTGFRALIWKYLYMLRKVRGHTVPKATEAVMRTELVKLEKYQRQFLLLHRNRIDTPEQLEAYMQSVRLEVQALTEQRESLYKQRKAAANPQPYEEQIQAINGRLRGLRKDLRTAEGIQATMEQIWAKGEQLRQAEQERPQPVQERKRSAREILGR